MWLARHRDCTLEGLLLGVCCLSPKMLSAHALAAATITAVHKNRNRGSVYAAPRLAYAWRACCCLVKAGCPELRTLPLESKCGICARRHTVHKLRQGLPRSTKSALESAEPRTSVARSWTELYAGGLLPRGLLPKSRRATHARCGVG